MRFKTIISLLFALFIFGQFVDAQTIYGKVFDTKKDTPLSGATVYLNGTTIGTITDFDGNFLIETNLIVRADLVISYVGYETQIVKDPYRDEVIEIIMLPKADDLKEVVIQTGRDFWSREKMLREFKRQFLGSERAADLCLIVNEDDIDLWMNPEKKILYGSSDVPIIFRNNYLGYKVEFTVSNFQALYSTLSPRYPDCLYVFYKGESFFQEITKDPETLERFEEVRQKAYTGSVSHFFRSLQRGNLRSDGFKLASKRMVIRPDKAYHKMDLEDHSILLFKRNFYVQFKERPRSYIFKEQMDVPLKVYEDGTYFPLEGIRIDGLWASDRMSKTLPKDYVPKL